MQKEEKCLKMVEKSALAGLAEWYLLTAFIPMYAMKKYIADIRPKISVHR